MNDTELLNLIIDENDDHFSDLIDRVIEKKVTRLIKSFENIEIIINQIKYIYSRIYRNIHVNFFIISQLYDYISNKPNFEENFNLILTLYDGTKEEFLDEYEYENE